MSAMTKIAKGVGTAVLVGAIGYAGHKALDYYEGMEAADAARLREDFKENHAGTLHAAIEAALQSDVGQDIAGKISRLPGGAAAVENAPKAGDMADNLIIAVLDKIEESKSGQEAGHGAVTLADSVSDATDYASERAAQAGGPAPEGGAEYGSRYADAEQLLPDGGGEDYGGQEITV